MKYLNVILILMIITTPLAAQSIDSLIIQGKTQLQQAVNAWQEPDLLQARAHFERLLTSAERNELVRYYIALADLRLTIYYIGVKNNDKAKQLVDEGIDYIKQTIELNADFADGHSLLSSLYGNKIGLNPIMGMVLGPKSGKAMERAMEIDAKNPRNHLIAGQSAFYTPKMFGGGKEKAKTSFERAIELYDSVKIADPLAPDWGYEEAYAWLGIYYKEQKNKARATELFKQALMINPEFGWVRNILLPSVSDTTESYKSE